MNEQTNDTKVKQSEVNDLSPEQDVKGGTTGVPLRDNDGNLAGAGRMPVK